MHRLAETTWTEQDNSLCRSFQFADFKTAWAFMSEVAAEAERLDHHPWWANEYGRVEFRLRTHDAGNTVTKRDHRLAAAIDAAAARYGVG
ncbi:4a-hydroxytetrahydrobiopterin dehydratase [Hymenobacter chitinivorans]|uniref:4a-hydroxytetrahydrobiopterin dehydratase n=1 Tax=Hymenobacter chitinivorans DSM 11115 TaxID=1121954 RepID=A0A2M9B4I3_9BACT|nr:4a-hydroxytetrahydrobiopterin dehydratase [Hymenobacter chitinivorans]PJJ52848.1 4a-hydroxytetrahydrobiopterin dehydratase [Hymenobacter chitinivorans DSM 11115]